MLAAIALMTAACQSGEKGYDWEADLRHRLNVDFCKTREQVKAHIQKYIPEVTEEQIDKWTKEGTLESMVIDGQTMYFDRTAANLFRVDPECKSIKDNAEGKTIPGQFMDFSGKANESLLDAIFEAGDSHAVAHPVKMKVKYTLSVDADAVPAGETIRCWLPFPRSDVQRQTEVRMVNVNSDTYSISDASFQHTTVYMEKTVEEGKPTVFEEEFEFCSSAEYFPLSSQYVAEAAARALGVSESEKLSGTEGYYDTSSELYRKYTGERESHIIFSERMRSLAAELTGELSNPYDKARRIFTWINDNFPWAGAREYSTIACIPEYVLNIGHGDCGQVTLLFCTLCRICGIPARFQSGWTMQPGSVGLHDWGEIYFEGIGWVPVDQSRGLMEGAVRTVPLLTAEGRVLPAVYTPDYPFEDKGFRELNEKMLYANLGGIDSFRLIVNQDYGMELSPAKRYPRSETVDFQRGEVEWAGGNIYFDQWDYHMEVSYK